MGGVEKWTLKQSSVLELSLTLTLTKKTSITIFNIYGDIVISKKGVCGGVCLPIPVFVPDLYTLYTGQGVTDRM